MGKLPTINSLWSLLTIALLIIVLALTFWGNSQNVAPSFIYIDEQITYYPIQKILHPSTWSEFFWLVGDGSDYRYGRILWNSMALAALIPEIIWGSTGQIIAGRELQVVLLLSAYLLLVKTLIKSNILQFLLLLTLIFAPYNSYFISMPKSEPMMLFCTACFIYFYKKESLLLGRPYWIFCGLAFGAKISFLPLLAIFLISSISINFDMRHKYHCVKKCLLTLLYLLIGFALANPYFLMPAFFLLYPFTLLMAIFYFLQPLKKGGIYIFIGIIGVALGTLVTLSPLREYVFNDLSHLIGLRHALIEWFHATFLRINDGNGEPTIRFSNWLAYYATVLYSSWPFFGYIYLATSVLLLTTLLPKKINLIPHRSQRSQEIFIIPTLIYLAGISLVLSPMISVHNRIWGMYLFLGTIFILIGIFASLDKTIRIERYACGKIKIASNIPLLLNLFLVGLTLYFLIMNWLPKFIDDMLVLANRPLLEYQQPLPPRLVGI